MRYRTHICPASPEKLTQAFTNAGPVLIEITRSFINNLEAALPQKKPHGFRGKMKTMLRNNKLPARASVSCCRTFDVRNFNNEKTARSEPGTEIYQSGRRIIKVFENMEQCNHVERFFSEINRFDETLPDVKLQLLAGIGGIKLGWLKSRCFFNMTPNRLQKEPLTATNVQQGLIFIQKPIDQSYPLGNIPLACPDLRIAYLPGTIVFVVMLVKNIPGVENDSTHSTFQQMVEMLEIGA